MPTYVTEKDTINVRLPKAMLVRIRDLATQGKRPLSSQVELMLEEWLAEASQ